jgi:hypothetical protein
VSIGDVAQFVEQQGMEHNARRYVENQSFVTPKRILPPGSFDLRPEPRKMRKYSGKLAAHDFDRASIEPEKILAPTPPHGECVQRWVRAEIEVNADPLSVVVI